MLRRELEALAAFPTKDSEKKEEHEK